MGVAMVFGAGSAGDVDGRGTSGVVVPPMAVLPHSSSPCVRCFCYHYVFCVGAVTVVAAATVAVTLFALVLVWSSSSASSCPPPPAPPPSLPARCPDPSSLSVYSSKCHRRYCCSVPLSLLPTTATQLSLAPGKRTTVLSEALQCRRT